MGFLSRLNPVKAVKSVVNVFKPGGSVLGKIYDAANGSVGGSALNAALKTSAQTVRAGSGLIADNIGGRIGKTARHWEGMANKDVHDQRRTFINAGKTAGALYGGAVLAPAAGAAVGGGALGGAATGAVAGGTMGAVQGQGLEGIAKGAALGGAAGGVAGMMGPSTGLADTVGQGAVRGGVNAGLRGNSISDGVLTGAAGAGAGSGASGLVGGGSLGGIVGRYVGGLASGAVGAALTGGQRGGSMAQQTNMGPTNQPGGAGGLVPQQGQGWDAGQILGGLGSLYQGYEGARNINGQLDNLNSLFSPNSPYAQQLEQQLIRKDAASGRRSQYGTRSVELQARLAEQAARLAPTIADLNKQKTGNMNSTVNSGLAAFRNSGLLNSALRQFPGIAKYFGNQNSMGIPLSNEGDFGKEDEVGNLMDRYPAPEIPSWAGSPQMDEFNTGDIPDWYSQEGP